MLMVTLAISLFVLQVTARGFGPLLQFAYTAKLLLSRENIREVIRCAEFLRIHNLEDSCFSFLQTQLLNREDGLFVCRKDSACQRPQEDHGNSRTGRARADASVSSLGLEKSLTLSPRNYLP